MIESATDHAGFRRRVELSPGWDKRHDDPNKNYGLHGVDLLFVLIGPKGAVHLLIYSGWMTKAVRYERADGPPLQPRWLHEPIAADLGYHSPTARREDHTSSPCPYLGCGACFAGGSALAANGGFDALTDGGDDAVWVMLHDYYAELFDRAPAEVAP